MSELERCFICDEPTGKAGKDDDSLYDEDGRGAYCEECFDLMLEELQREAISDQKCGWVSL